MATLRLPRFRRDIDSIPPMVLTRRDLEILRFVHRHRFLRSSHITALLNESGQQILRRLQLLYHHGFLERPRAQLDYYHEGGGSRQIVYGLGNKGAGLIKRELNLQYHDVNWPAKDTTVGRLFLEHALLVSDVLIRLEQACRAAGNLRLLLPEDFPAFMITPKRHCFRWKVLVNSRLEIGVVPDAAFAIQSVQEPENLRHFFLEADRGTMPITRATLAQSSFYRKLLAYQATWLRGLHRSEWGLKRFRVLTVTTDAARVKRLAEAKNLLNRGRGLFLIIDWDTLANHPFAVLES